MFLMRCIVKAWTVIWPGDLSETLRPHVQEGVSEELRELVEMLKEEYPNLWIDRWVRGV